MITLVCCYNGSWVEMGVSSDSSELIQVPAIVQCWRAVKH